MNKTSLLAMIIAGLMVSPSLTMAKTHDNSYKPKAEKGAKKKNKKKVKKNKGQKKAGNKKAQAKKVTKKAHKTPPVVQRQHVHRKKSKSKRFKRFLKRTVRDIGRLAIESNRQRHVGPAFRDRRHYRAHPDLYCLPKHKIRKRLVRRGWHDFHLIGRGPNRIRLAATNFNGRRFKIVVDRCTGTIIKRRPIRRYWSRGF